MSTYKSFAVVGGGSLGGIVINSLVAKNVSVVVLSRPESAPKTFPAGVQIVKVDYANSAAVAAAFKTHKVEVVISTITTDAAGAQTPLVEAARLAGVKLFAPSEFGMPTEGQTEGLLGLKNRIAEELKAAGVPSVRFYTGVFMEGAPWLFGYTDHGKIRIVGTGEVPVSFTSIVDIGGFVAHVVTTLPPSELANRVFRLEGERRTLNELGPLFKTTVEHVDQIPGELGELRTGLIGLMGAGPGSTGWDAVSKVEGSGSKAAGSASAYWPGHQWKTLKEVHNL
ncbi:hypothetical protein DFH09DRAFT_227325 [Mycena vulgaris]|nr:hypothetical protein DFH09DRAFT_227325 [Mycena vulgaris]